MELHAGYALLSVVRGAVPTLAWVGPIAVAINILAHLLILGAAVSFLAARRPGHARDGLIDAATVVVAVVLQWSARPGGPGLQWRQAVPLTLALFLVAALVVGLRLLLSERRSPSLLLPEGRPPSPAIWSG